MRRIGRSVWVGAAFLLLTAPPLQAQNSVTVDGRVLLPDGSPAADVAVSVQVHDGSAIVHQDAAIADGNGEVTFTGVPSGPGHLARLGALFDGATYYSEPSPLEEAGVRVPIIVRVAEITAEGRPLHLDTMHIILQAETPTRFRVLQFVTVSNAGDAAWAGGPALADGRPSGITIPIPRTASDVRPAPFPSPEESLPVGQIEIGPDRVLDPRPVPPSGRQGAVTYLLDTSDGAVDVALALPYPTQSVSLLLGGAGAGEVVLDRTNLQPRPAESIGDERYEMWAAEALPPGTEVTFRLGTAGEPLLPAYGWALAGLGLALLAAMAGSRVARPGQRDEAMREEILESIARLDVAHEAGESSDAEYHLARSREIERLLLLEERLATRGASSGNGG